MSDVEMICCAVTAATDEVDEDYAERPDIVRRRVVLRQAVRDTTEALRAHVECAAASKVRAPFIARGKTEVREHNLRAVLQAEDVLRLNVAVVDAELVAVLDGVENLAKHALDEYIHA